MADLLAAEFAGTVALGAAGGWLANGSVVNGRSAGCGCACSKSRLGPTAALFWCAASQCLCAARPSRHCIPGWRLAHGSKPRRPFDACGRWFYWRRKLGVSGPHLVVDARRQSRRAAWLSNHIHGERRDCSALLDLRGLQPIAKSQPISDFQFPSSLLFATPSGQAQLAMVDAMDALRNRGFAEAKLRHQLMKKGSVKV